MSTRSYIGKLNTDGTVRAIYHHWDGYLEGVGEVLLHNYTDEAKIEKLLDLGDMSSIGTEPVAAWSDFGGDSTKCMTYRARGESGTDAKTYSSVDSYLDVCDEDFTYLFKDGEWFYREWDDRELKPIKNEIR